MASPNALLSGITALILVLTGFISGGISFARAYQKKSSRLVIVGIFLLTLGGYYLGITLSLISLLVTEVNLPEVLVGQICYVGSPFGIAVAMYLGFSIVKPKVAKPITIAFACLAPIFWIAMFGFPAENITSQIPPEDGGGLIDLQLIGTLRLLNMIYILAFGLLLIPTFAYFAKKSQGGMRTRALLHVAGYTLFVIGATLDSLFLFSAFIAAVRLIMVVAYLCMFLGYTKEF